MARRAVSEVVECALSLGVEYRQAQVTPPFAGRHTRRHTRLLFRRAMASEFRRGNLFLPVARGLEKYSLKFLARVYFPAARRFSFLACRRETTNFPRESLPTWLIQADEVYGMPDLESRGFKIAFDSHGERVDPDTQTRVVSAESIERVRAYVAKRFPALANAPIVETRVCQYENTSNGDFLIDRHPEMSNVWFAGGGSGHGFKHGPAFGEYVAQQILDGGPAEPRFCAGEQSDGTKACGILTRCHTASISAAETFAFRNPSVVMTAQGRSIVLIRNCVYCHS